VIASDAGLSSCRALLAIVFIAFLFLGCSRQAAPPTDSSSAKPLLTSSPPFSTREPERYQGTRITTIEHSGPDPYRTTKTTIIARNGINRREEYETISGVRLIYLENAAGRFVLLPSAKLYANLDEPQADNGLPPSDGITAGVADALLNQANNEASYEKLGAEELNGRKVAKYRVTGGGSTAAPSTTLIWIDEVLGMAVRSESSSGASGDTFKVITELRNIELEADRKLFELPKDYKQVSHLTLANAYGEATQK
jgi:ribosomal protein S10